MESTLLYWRPLGGVRLEDQPLGIVRDQFGAAFISVFYTVLGGEIPIDKMGGSGPAESVRPLGAAPPVRYAWDDG
jgi:hypothetical protein